MFCATYTGSSFPSTSFRLSLTRISTLHRQHRTLSYFWQTQPRLAHSTSLTRAGFGVQSVMFENVFRRARNAVRSQGAYLGVSLVNDADAQEADFLWVIVDRRVAEDEVFDKVFFLVVEAEGIMRRFFASESASPVAVKLFVAKSTLEALFTPFDDNEVVDLLPIPLRRALNFRFVAFMAGEYKETSLILCHTVLYFPRRKTCWLCSLRCSRMMVSLVANKSPCVPRGLPKTSLTNFKLPLKLQRTS